MLKAALHYLGTRLAQPFYAGVGSILALHRVVPEPHRSRLTVNRALEITPRDLDEIIGLLRARGFEFAPMDAVLDRLRSRRGRKFAVFTLDDAYRDNVEHALPIFERHEVPFTVYAARGLCEHVDSAWWYALEEALCGTDRVEINHRGRELAFQLPDDAARMAAFAALARELRACALAERDELLAQICRRAGVDPLRSTRELILPSAELRALSQHSLATIGAHTVHHLTSNVLDETTLRAEFAGSKQWLKELCGKDVRHLAYPFGGRNAVGAREFAMARLCGFETAVTTRFANVFPAHADTPWALPRLEISGNYRAEVFTERAVSGLLPAVRHRGRRVVVE